MIPIHSDYNDPLLGVFIYFLHVEYMLPPFRTPRPFIVRLAKLKSGCVASLESYILLLHALIHGHMRLCRNRLKRFRKIHRLLSYETRRASYVMKSPFAQRLKHFTPL